MPSLIIDVEEDVGYAAVVRPERPAVSCREAESLHIFYPGPIEVYVLESARINQQ